jgi:hypothetical protein
MVCFLLVIKNGIPLHMNFKHKNNEYDIGNCL